MKSLIASVTLLALSALIITGCSQEATTRKAQERAFTETFGFPPTGEITNISYHSSGVWAPNLGGYLSLMRFTYVPSVVERIEQKYGLSLQPASFAPVGKPPEWWHEPPPNQQIFYGTTNGDVRCMWIDNERGFVFYQEFNVD